MNYRYYESDFAIVMTIKAKYIGGSDGQMPITTAYPFTFRYFIKGKQSQGEYIASFDGENTTNCQILDEKSVIVYFDRTILELGIGELMVETSHDITDAHFEGDNVQNVKRFYSTDITLTDKPDLDYDEEESIDITLLPLIIRGASGDAATQEMLERANEAIQNANNAADGLATQITNIENYCLSVNTKAEEAKTAAKNANTNATSALERVSTFTIEYNAKLLTKYEKPLGGIPLADLSQDVKEAIQNAGKADGTTIVKNADNTLSVKDGVFATKDDMADFETKANNAEQSANAAQTAAESSASSASSAQESAQQAANNLSQIKQEIAEMEADPNTDAALVAKVAHNTAGLNDLAQKIKEVESELSNISDIEIEYNISDLEDGNCNNNHIGEVISFGEITNYKNLVIPVRSGAKINITAFGGNAASCTLGFLDSNKIVIKHGQPGQLVNYTYTIEEESYISINHINDGSHGDFHLYISNVNRFSNLENKVTKLEKEYNDSIYSIEPILSNGNSYIVRDGDQYSIAKSNTSVSFEWIKVKQGDKFYFRGNCGSSLSRAAIVGSLTNDGNGLVLLVPSNGDYVETEFEIPDGINYIFAWVRGADDYTHEFYKIVNNISFVKDNYNEVTKEISKHDEKIKQLERDNYIIEYDKSNLIPGNAEISVIGRVVAFGTLTTTYKYGLFPCDAGCKFYIHSVAGTRTARAIAFLDEDKKVVWCSPAESLYEGEKIVPQGVYYICVNSLVEYEDEFALKVYPKTLSILENVEAEIKDVKGTQEVIPMYYGKDMFFIKDIPLNIYAQNVLRNNYPKYDGIYVNCAPQLAVTDNPNFDFGEVNYIGVAGDVYFKDGMNVDIIANNKLLYRDSWNIIRNINVHTTDIATKIKSIKALFIGSSTTEIGMATYVKKYLEALGVSMTSIGSHDDYLGTPSEGYWGWNCMQLAGKYQNSTTYPQSGPTPAQCNTFMKLATSEDKSKYPDFCFTYVEGSTGSRQSYTEAIDKSQDFYIFDFDWYLKTRGLETPDVVFFLLGANDSDVTYKRYMPWIVDRIIQACPNAHIGINVLQAVRFEESAVDHVLTDDAKFNDLYSYVNGKNNPKLKVVSIHAHQTAYFAHGYDYHEGLNSVTEVATVTDGYLHMKNAGYIQCAKCIGAYIAYCLEPL